MQLAARLCAQAKPDQILAAEDFIRHHAGDRSLFSELGLITPKGFDQQSGFMKSVGGTRRLGALRIQSKRVFAREAE